MTARDVRECPHGAQDDWCPICAPERAAASPHQVPEDTCEVCAPKQCGHTQLLVRDFANQPTPYGECLFCQRAALQAELDAVRKMHLQTRHLAEQRYDEVDRLREEITLLDAVLTQARVVLLTSLQNEGQPSQSSLAKLSDLCRAHYDWRTTRISTALAAGDEGAK